MLLNKSLLILTITSLALMAGLFYSFTISIMPGLARTQDRTFLEAMQSINKAIINPFFILAFVGSIILVILCCIMQYKQGITPQFYTIFAASIIYLAGVIGITFFGNVPLNNALDALDIQRLTIIELKNAREMFETSWNRFNLIRTLSSLIAFVLYVVAVMREEG